MKRHGRAAVVVVAVAAVIVVVALFLVARGGDGAPDATASAEITRSFSWPAGTVIRYDVEHTSSTDTSFPGAGKDDRGSLPARTHLQGRLIWRSYGKRGATPTTTIGVRFASLDDASVTIAGQEIMTSPDELTDSEAVLEVKDDGEVVSLAFASQVPELHRNLLNLVVTETEVTLGAGASWSALEPTLQGVASSRYAVVSEGAERLALARTRDAYTSLTAARAYGHALPHTVEGTARAVVVPGGYVEELSASEHLVAGDGVSGPRVEATTSTSLRLVALERSSDDAAAAPTAASDEHYAPGELAVTSDFAAQRSAARADGLTGKELLQTLATFANGGQVPDHNRFLWRATGLLRGDPDLCRELEAMYEREPLTLKGRGLVLDLLVGAGTPAAQQALRDALASGAGSDASGFHLLYQRIGLVRAPDAQMLAFAEERERSPGAEGKGAALYAYASVVGRRLARGHDDAQAGSADLLARLADASSANDQVVLLGALGNVADPAHAHAVVAMAESEEPTVRAAVAYALRRQTGDEVRTTLVNLVGDSDGEVQRTALTSLSRRALTDDDLKSIKDVASGARIGAAGYDLVLNVMSQNLDRDGAREVTAAILAQRIDNKAVLARAKDLLSRFTIARADADAE